MNRTGAGDGNPNSYDQQNPLMSSGLVTAGYTARGVA